MIGRERRTFQSLSLQPDSPYSERLELTVSEGRRQGNFLLSGWLPAKALAFLPASAVPFPADQQAFLLELVSVYHLPEVLPLSLQRGARFFPQVVRCSRRWVV